MNHSPYKVFFNFNNTPENDFVLQIAVIHQNKENIFNIKQNGDLFLVHSANHELEIYFDSKANVIFSENSIKIFSKYHQISYENNRNIKLIFENYLTNNPIGLQEFIRSKDKINLIFTIEMDNHHQLKDFYFEMNDLRLNNKAEIPHYEYLKFAIKILDDILKYGKIN